MVFTTFEDSVETSRPIELYTITLGVTIWRYVVGELAVTFGGDVFEPLAISRESASQSQEDQDRQLIVTLPATTEVVREYIDSVPGQSAVVRIERYQKSDGATPERIIMFEGAILTVSFSQSGKTATLAIRALDKALSRTIPRNVYSSICNHVLYDTRCTVSKVAFRIVAVVTVQVGRVLTVPGLSAQVDGFFKAGYVENTSSLNPDRRLILEHIGDLITLSLPFAKSVLGQSIRVHAGCDHTAPICKSKFNNLPNYGGFPFVPTVNIFQNGLK